MDWPSLPPYKGRMCGPNASINRRWVSKSSSWDRSQVHGRQGYGTRRDELIHLPFPPCTSRKNLLCSEVTSWFMLVYDGTKKRNCHMLLQACLNGSRTPGEHPALPISPLELARDAQRVIAAGAHALHIHPRNA